MLAHEPVPSQTGRHEGISGTPNRGPVLTRKRIAELPDQQQVKLGRTPVHHLNYVI